MSIKIILRTHLRLPDETGKQGETLGRGIILKFAGIQGASFCGKMLDQGVRLLAGFAQEECDKVH
jgi:hypothetical protein